MNRRKQTIQAFRPNFHDRRKRWSDRRRGNRWWGSVLVPFVRLKAWLAALLGLRPERH